MSDTHSAPKRPAPDRAVHIALFWVQVAFGSLAVEGKIAMSPRFGVSPAALAMSRMLGGAIVFVLAHILLKTPRVVSLADRLKLGLLAVFGIVLNQALFLFGLSRTSPVAATLLVATIPIFAAAVAAIARIEALTRRTIVGISLALFGIAVLSRFQLPALGDLLVLLNSLSYACYVVFAKRLLGRYGTVTVVAWIFGWGAVLFAPIGAISFVHEVSTWSLGTIGLVAYIVLVPTMLAYGASAWALRRATPTLVTIYIYVQPLVVVTLAWIQLGHRLEMIALVAGLLILGGVTIVAKAPRTQPTTR